MQKQLKKHLYRCFFLSFWQYCVQSLSVQLEHLSAAFVVSEKRSGYSIMHDSQTISANIAVITSDSEKNPPQKISGENIII